ncbi:hypothetical protein HDU81_005233 [Chytriomyces hyalinus]|nr:hypothetical protein HDU81_005233 [Chytriomyces hyalinus]
MALLNLVSKAMQLARLDPHFNRKMVGYHPEYTCLIPTEVSKLTFDELCTHGYAGYIHLKMLQTKRSLPPLHSLRFACMAGHLSVVEAYGAYDFYAHARHTITVDWAFHGLVMTACVCAHEDILQFFLRRHRHVFNDILVEDIYRLQDTGSCDVLYAAGFPPSDSSLIQLVHSNAAIWNRYISPDRLVKNIALDTINDNFVHKPHKWKHVEFVWTIFHCTGLYDLDTIFMECLCDSDLAGIEFFIIHLDYELPPFYLIEDLLRSCTQEVLDFLVLHVPSPELIDLVHLLDFL